jgi:menaquinone-dependent protoporphyrinogen oxidase
MNFLIVYGSTEGQTRKISEFAALRMQTLGHQVTLLDSTTQAAHDVKLRDFDGVVIAASLHVGMYQAAVEDFVRTRHDMLNGMRTLFVSVSLAAASKDDDDLKGLEKCLQRFLTATSWRPGSISHVEGAFRYTRYDFFKRWGMKLIAREKGVSTDTSRDLEMTNWVNVASIVDAFVSSVVKAGSAAKVSHA